MLNKIFTLLLTFIVSILSAQAGPPVPGNGGAGGVGPGEPTQNSINMYEGVLLGIAVVMILGYYLYSKNKRIV